MICLGLHHLQDGFSGQLLGDPGSSRGYAEEDRSGHSNGAQDIRQGIPIRRS